MSSGSGSARRPKISPRLTGWLASHGFAVEEVGRGRTWINFSGTAADVERAFRTRMRDYRVDGTLRHANAQDPSIPRGLADLVAGVVSLHNFPRKSMISGVRATPLQSQPEYTSGSTHYLAPGDFATIYNLNPLYAAGIDGTGQSIAIVGRTNPSNSSTKWATFRSLMALPANAPQIIVNGADPGDQGANEDVEADLDVEWSGAVARNATIKFVTSKSTISTDGVDLSAQYIVNNNLAPVMSTSFGLCEQDLGSGNTFYNNLWAQAASQGITSFVSTGDSGAAGCDSPSSPTASGGLAVNGLASTPYNVAVGGTEFNEDSGSYWNSSNGTGYTSAKSYIPEVAWNESGNVSGGSGLWATGGGASTLYGKPVWQVAPGVPADGHRDIPDVSLTAAIHDGYLVESVYHHSTALLVVGGTSASSPSFAGLMALVVQKTGQRQGNANVALYQLGTAQYGAAGAAVFHDTTSGNNSVPGLTGYSCTTRYDLATGLGSVDANALVTNWPVPDLTVASTHTGNFTQGQTGAQYTLTVTNSGTWPTTGEVTVTDTLPSLLTATAMTGTGWNCTLATLTCTRSDVLAASASYPAITLTVNVANNAPASVTNTATVAGGGEVNSANDTASDVTTIIQVADLTVTKGHTGNFSPGQTGAQYTITATNSGPGPTSSTVTMTDTLPAGLTATALSGSGWSCTLGTLTCTRSDVLAAGASYPAITLTVNVANDAPVSLTNTATVSGGGEFTTSNDTATDPTTVDYLPVRIDRTPPLYYSDIQTACNHAENGDTVQIQALDFAETLSLDNGNGTMITLQGGYDAGYAGDSGLTTITGSMTIISGEVVGRQH